MKFYQQSVSPFEVMLYFGTSLPFVGTFYQTEHVVLKNLLETGLMSEALLTSDFIYLKGKSSEQLSDLVMLAGAELDDYTTSQNSVGVAPVSDIEVKIKLILRLVISPLLKKDGGNIELVEYANNVVKVRFLGKCQGCPYAQNTLKNHVEKKMIQYLPYISKVELV